MHITIIGTGNMARAIGERALAGGHDVTVVVVDRQDHQVAVERVTRERGLHRAVPVPLSQLRDGPVGVL